MRRAAPLPHLAVTIALACAASLGAQRRPVERELRDLAADTPHAATLASIDSGRKGPTVLVVGALAPDEPSAWRAARQISGWTPKKGVLHVLLRRSAATGDGDGYPQAEREAPRGEFARRLWPLLTDLEPDLLIVLREADGIGNRDADARGNTIVVTGPARTAKLVDNALDEVHGAVRMGDRRFVRGAAPEPGDLLRAQADVLGRAGIGVFVTRDSQSSPLRVRFHRLVVHGLLAAAGMLDAAPAPHGADAMIGLAAGEDEVRVGIYVSSGASGDGPERLEALLTAAAAAANHPREPGFVVRQLGSTDVQVAGLLEQFDVVVFPSGDAAQQAQAIGPAGLEALAAYVTAGGGFVGIGAGAELAGLGEGRLGILGVRAAPLAAADPLELRWSSAGRSLVGRGAEGSPPSDGAVALAPAAAAGVAEVEVLADAGGDEQPLIVRSQSGRGTVIGIGARLERVADLDEVTRALLRAAARPKEAPRRRGR